MNAGDLLVQLDDSVERAAVAQAEPRSSQAKARVARLRRVGAIVATGR
ncbi:MAG: efflux RND transporter periplasmic adaptor subunit, partial [Myxococcales bacterium]|nr:efflux RND transporter periplasmic adaptor subunit [Myxococcales bacterium]